MKDVEYFKKRFESLKDEFEAEVGFEDIEQLKGEVEMEMIYIDNTRNENFKKLSKLRDEIRQFIEKNTKKKNNHYDLEAELDRMFPDRHDDDFDEESMSYDSIFGDD